MNGDVIWVNVDHPTKCFTIHKVEDCKYVMKKAETPYKGIDTMKQL